MTMPTETMYREFIAQKVFLGVSKVLDPYPALKENAKITEQVIHTIQSMCLNLTTWCMAGRIPSDIQKRTIKWPSGVWQTFKEKFMPRWFTNRFPVLYESTTVDVTTNHYFVCPHLVTSDRGEHVRFMATGTDMAQYFGGPRR